MRSTKMNKSLYIVATIFMFTSFSITSGLYNNKSDDTAISTDNSSPYTNIENQSLDENLLIDEMLLTLQKEGISKITDLKNNLLSPKDIALAEELHLRLNPNKHNILSSSLINFLAKLFRLKTLALSNNNLTEINPRISNLTQLEKLNLSKNNLTKIPYTLGELVQLL